MPKARTTFELVSNSLIDTVLPIDSSRITVEPIHQFEIQNVVPLVARSQHTFSRRAVSFQPDSTQKLTIGIIGAYAVIIGILWHVPFLKHVLYPFKMLTIAFHEFSHAIVGLCTGARIKSIKLDVHEGGVTTSSGGLQGLILPAGYLGSAFIGACLIFAGFNIVASKVASIVLGVTFLLIIWWARRDWLTILTILAAVGLIVAFWFISHAVALRFLVLFIGTMSNLYSIWDITDDLILRKVNESDASVFSRRYGGSSACWGVIWALISLIFMAAAILGGIAAFKQDYSQQVADSAKFLPTRW